MVQFASYVRRVLHKTRLIFSRINGPIVSLLWSLSQTSKRFTFVSIVLSLQNVHPHKNKTKTRDDWQVTTKTNRLIQNKQEDRVPGDYACSLIHWTKHEQSCGNLRLVLFSSQPSVS